jgi:hypothetical protein
MFLSKLYEKMLRGGQVDHSNPSQLLRKKLAGKFFAPQLAWVAVVNYRSMHQLGPRVEVSVPHTISHRIVPQLNPNSSRLVMNRVRTISH